MALNEAFRTTDELQLPVLANVVAGAAVVVGGIHGIAETSYNPTTGRATVKVKPSSAWNMSVQAISSLTASPQTGSAVAIGDSLYASGSPEIISKDSGGTLIGYALETITSGTTQTIKVWLS